MDIIPNKKDGFKNCCIPIKYPLLDFACDNELWGASSQFEDGAFILKGGSGF